MTDRPPLAKSELEVARIVWRLGSATVRAVLDELPAERELDFKTVQTYLRRLEAKGYLRTRLEGRTKIYLPRVQPQTAMRQMIDDFVSRLFDGQALSLVQHLIDERGLSDDEIRQLREQLNRRENKS